MRLFGVNTAYDCLQCFRAAVDFEVFFCTGDGGIEDAVSDPFGIVAWNDDFHRIILKTLRLVDGDCIGELERDDGTHLCPFVIIVRAVIMLRYSKLDPGRVFVNLDQSKLRTMAIFLCQDSFHIHRESDLIRGSLDVDKLAFQIVIENRETAAAIEEDPIALFIGPFVPGYRRPVGVCVLEEAIHVVQTEFSIVVQTEDHLVRHLLL